MQKVYEKGLTALIAAVRASKSGTQLGVKQMSVALTILKQLGGNRFKAMTGAKNLVTGERMLQFSIPKSKGINKVRVELNEADLYNVSFYNLKGIDCTLVEYHPGIYADGLPSLFERVTGLYTSL